MKNFPRVLALAVSALLFAASLARAQDVWSSRASGTSSALWGVASGNNQWVAVGEQGVILTSPDALTWTARISGFPARWLVAVGYGAGTWVVVGESGLILTSPNAITWTLRPAITTARLNGIAYGGGRWMAVAESGELLTSTDSVTWTRLSPSGDRLRGILYAYGQFVITGDNGLMRTTIDATDYAATILPGSFFVESVAYARRAFIAVGEEGFAVTSTDAVTWTRLASGTTSYLRGITFFNGQFIAVGSEGAILTTPAPGTAWTTRSSGSTAALTAVAASDAAAVAVGLGGTILRSAPFSAPPFISVPPASSIAIAGDNILFSVTAIGSLPLSYQWLFNGQPLAGETADRLLLVNVQPAQAGSYTARVTNVLNTTTSAPAALTFPPPTAPGSIVDPTFTPTLLTNGNVTAAVEQADGKLIIGGSNFFVTAGVSPFALARLNLDGSLDSTFNLGSGLNGGGSVANLVAQSDGRILVAGTFQSINGIARPNLARLNIDGSLDPSFVAAASATTQALQTIAVQSDGKILLRNGTQLFRLNADGSLDATFVGATNGFAISIFVMLLNGQILAGSPDILRRLNVDGSIDGTFTPYMDKLPPNGVFPYRFDALQRAPDGAVFLRQSIFAGIISDNVLLRFNPDGSLDPTWNGIRKSYAGRGSISMLSAIDPLGNIFVASTTTSIPGPITTTMERFKPDASIDFTFDAGAGPSSTDSYLTAIFPLRNGRVVVAGNFTTFDGIARPKLARLVAANATEVRPPTIISVTPEAASVLPGAPVTLTVSAAGAGPLTYSWGGFQALPGQSSNKSAISMSTVTSRTYTITVTVSNRAGAVTSTPVRVVVAPSAPILLTQPVAIATTAGRDAIFTVGPAGSSPFTHQWFQGTNPVGTGVTLTLNRISSANAGIYTVVVTNSLGSTRSFPVPLTVDGSAQLVNLSTRAGVGPGERTLIAGFVIGGTTSKSVLVRGVGPALAAFGLTGLLPDPTIALFDSTARMINGNDNTPFAVIPSGFGGDVGAFPLATNSLDAALVTTLTPGSYTVQVTDVSGRSGIALVEIYEADNTTGRLVNLSSRAFVGTGASIAIGGISVKGEKARQFLIRGIGPALAGFGVAGALADPVLTLTTALGATVAANDDWGSAANALDIANAAVKVGAFPLPFASKDSALLLTLAPGNYTALVSGANATTGIALIEVYDVP